MGTRGFASFRNKVNSARRTLNRAERRIPRRAATFGVGQVKRQLIESDLVVSTELWRSVDSQSLGVGKAVILVKAPYAGYVEHGTGAKGDGTYKAPSDVPVSEIFQWMLQKPTFAGDISWFKAFVIAESLEREGQRQQPFFEPAWDDTVTFVKGQMRDTLRRAL